MKKKLSPWCRIIADLDGLPSTKKNRMSDFCPENALIFAETA